MTNSIAPTPDITTFEDSDIGPASAFRVTLGAYAYQPSRQPSQNSQSPRRSPRKHTPGKFRLTRNSREDGSATDTHRLPSPFDAMADERGERSPSPSKPGSSSPRKRVKSSSHKEDDEKPRKRKKRGYAAPETYAHLNPLDDYLADDLDVVFCGINPGYDSARFGLHYAHPTNHFWRCLHLSGFTSKLLPPSDGPLLPQTHNIGLTNLIERPSAEAGELSREEMISAVPRFLAQIRQRRPRVVCFVGKVIWDAIERVLRQHSHKNLVPPTPPQSAPSSGALRGRSQSPTKRRPIKQAFTWGLQPYKLPHAAGASATLIFVVPSTSARVVSHQLPQKAALFSALKALVDELRANTFDNSAIIAVDVPVVDFDDSSGRTAFKTEAGGRTAALETERSAEAECRDEDAVDATRVADMEPKTDAGV